MALTTIQFETSGERFYEITEQVKEGLARHLREHNTENASGILYLYSPHTSNALTISESFDSSARIDMENFMKHVAPRNLPFITHTAEGSDDSPSHMKSILLQNHLAIFVEEGEMIMGTWQGIYLCEFRDGNKNRKMHLKFISEP